jgi:hypothetical protein
VAVDDIGTVINPMIAAGQLHGIVYDASGQLLSGSFMDYCMPRADNLASMSIETHSTSCAHTPMGVKGCGEVGTIGSPAAVMNAVVDALSHTASTTSTCRQVRTGSGSSCRTPRRGARQNEKLVREVTLRRALVVLGVYSAPQRLVPHIRESRQTLEEIRGVRCVTFAQTRTKMSQLPMAFSPPIEPAPTLLSAPIELAGSHAPPLGRSGRRAHAIFMPRWRSPVSDRQPTRLRVFDSKPSSRSDMRWILFKKMMADYNEGYMALASILLQISRITQCISRSRALGASGFGTAQQSKGCAHLTPFKRTARRPRQGT